MKLGIDKAALDNKGRAVYLAWPQENSSMPHSLLYREFDLSRKPDSSSKYEEMQLTSPGGNQPLRIEFPQSLLAHLLEMIDCFKDGKGEPYYIIVGEEDSCLPIRMKIKRKGRSMWLVSFALKDKKRMDCIDGAYVECGNFPFYGNILKNRYIFFEEPFVSKLTAHPGFLKRFTLE